MVQRRGTIGAALALLLMAGALVGVSGCASRRATFEPGSAGATEQSASAGTAESATAAVSTATATPASQLATQAAKDAAAGSGAASGGSATSGLSTKDASTLDAELSAIQSELDRLSVPSDSDFDNIGSGLK
jgi:hypothetical protein